MKRRSEKARAAGRRAGNALREGAGGTARRWIGLPSRTRAAVLVFLACLLVYTAVMVFAPRYTGATTAQGDEPHYLLVAESLIRDGDVFLTNNYKERQYLPYFEEDGIMWHVTHGRGGRFVSTHPMFLSLVVLPGFWLFGYAGAAFTMVLVMCAAAAFSFLAADRFASRIVAAGVTLFLFLSYPLLFYSRMIYPETAAVLLMSLSLWSAWRLRESGRLLFAGVIGACGGGLLLLHPKYIALSVALVFLFALVKPAGSRRPAVAFAVPALLAIVLLLALTAVAFGPNVAKGLTASGGSKFQGGYWGTNSVWGIPGMFLDRAWGLFAFAPFYALFLHGLSLPSNGFEWESWWIFWPVCVGLHVLVLGVFQSWNGGAAPVQRYLVPLAPLFLVCVAMFIDRVRSSLARGAAFALALLQVVTTIWTFRFFIGVYGMENSDNIFLAHFLGDEAAGRLLSYTFPLFHPAGEKAILLTFAWVAFLGGTAYAARRYYMKVGGGRLSPLVDIRPFEKAVEESAGLPVKRPRAPARPAAMRHRGP